MEGVLWKWTNYWNGWQPRWFVLDNGVLAYYMSQDEVNQGCKGSVKMTACEIAVHQTDQTRLDLVIPAEQHFYLKASTATDRQQWLVALGSAKACLRTQHRHNSASDPPDTLKSKKSELRLYSDLLMQQVHTVKSICNESDKISPYKLDEATALIGATCDTFIKTLEDCIRIADANFTYELPHQHVTDSALSPLPSPTSTIPSGLSHATSSSNKKASRSKVVERCHSVDRIHWDEDRQKSPRLRTLSDAQCNDDNKTDGALGAGIDSGQVHPNETVYEDEIEDEMQHGTIFSKMKHSFMDIKFMNDGGIPADIFVSSSISLLTVFDRCNCAAFFPVTQVAKDSLKSIEKIIELDANKDKSLQTIILQELKENKSKNLFARNVRIIQRSLEFVKELLKSVVISNDNLSQSIRTIYEIKLSKCHNSTQKNSFYAQLKSVPSTEYFIRCLMSDSSDCAHPSFRKRLLKDTECFVTALDVVLKILVEFFQIHCTGL